MMRYSFVSNIFMEQSIAGRTRTRRTQEQIRELLSEFEVAGCTVKEFCQLKGINNGNFHKWRSRLREGVWKKDKAAGFSRVVVHPSLGDHLFAEVNGIRFYQVVSAAYLKELIA
jgi:hypothetical protein